MQGPLTLVAAGAGSGKTVLLSSWLRSGGPGLPTAWLAVDTSQAIPNSPSRRRQRA